MLVLLILGGDFGSSSFKLRKVFVILAFVLAWFLKGCSGEDLCKFLAYVERGRCMFFFF